MCEILHRKNLHKGKVALCIIAHPDDETLFAGALLAMMARRGIETHIICATRGEDGEAGDPPICRQSELGKIREGELRDAATALNVKSVEIIGYLNPEYIRGSDNLTAFQADSNDFEKRIINSCDRLLPDVIITHGSQGEYGHPGHVLVHQTVLRAHHILRSRVNAVAPALYSFSAAAEGQTDNCQNFSDPADIVIDIQPWLKIKTAAIEQHRTQHGMFYRTFPKARTMSELILSRSRTESLHRIWVHKEFDETVFFGER